MKKDKKDKKTDIPKKSNKKEPVKKNKVRKKKKPETLIKTIEVTTVSEETLKNSLREIVEQYQVLQTMPQFYGSDTLYYRSEINILNTLSNMPGANLTAIASALNISKSAVSKGTLKLINRALITKERSSISTREVIFNLTAEGEALCNHIKMTHKELYANVNQVFKNLSNDDKKVISHFTDNLHDALSVSIGQLKK